MLHSCKYCGRIHESSYVCPARCSNRKKKNNADVFRSSAAWKRKREEIKERDYYLCQVCSRNLYGTLERYNKERLSVHHAIPLETNYEMRLENSNLLTLCAKHHEMAENGEIPYHVVAKIIREQEEKDLPPGDYF